MKRKYTYPVADQALRNFLIVVLILLAVVTVAVATGTTFGVLDIADIQLSLGHRYWYYYIDLNYTPDCCFWAP